MIILIYPIFNPSRSPEIYHCKILHLSSLICHRQRASDKFKYHLLISIYFDVDHSVSFPRKLYIRWDYFKVPPSESVSSLIPLKKRRWAPVIIISYFIPCLTSLEWSCDVTLTQMVERESLIMSWELVSWWILLAWIICCHQHYQQPDNMEQSALALLYYSLHSNRGDNLRSSRYFFQSSLKPQYRLYIPMAWLSWTFISCPSCHVLNF